MTQTPLNNRVDLVDYLYEYYKSSPQSSSYPSIRELAEYCSEQLYLNGLLPVVGQPQKTNETIIARIHKDLSDLARTDSAEYLPDIIACYLWEGVAHYYDAITKSHNEMDYQTDLKKTIRSLQRVKELDMLNVPAHYIVGVVCYETGSFIEAASNFTTVLHLNDQRPILYALAADSLSRTENKGNIIRAKSYASQALEKIKAIAIDDKSEDDKLAEQLAMTVKMYDGQ